MLPSIASLLASVSISFAPVPAQEPVVVAEDVVVYADRVEFTKEFNDAKVEKESFFFPFSQDLADPTTIDDCVASAQIACGTHGIKWLRFRVNPTTGEVSCEFECNPGTGSGS